MKLKIKSYYILRFAISIAILFFISSCGIHKNLATTQKQTSVATTISVDTTKKTIPVATTKKDTTIVAVVIPHDSIISSTTSCCDTEDTAIESLQKKYAALLGVQPSEIKNIELYKMVDDWMGVPYHWGGTSKTGCDCVGLCKVFYKELYDKVLSGAAYDVYPLCNVVQKKDLQESDFVFFKIGHPYISHIGIYLQNGYFVHASVKGVMIDNLSETYYKTYYYCGGRLKQ